MKGMNQMKFSRHLRNDRADRVNFILNTVGFGKIVKMIAAGRDGRTAWRGITNTGVMVITDGEKETVLTMWIASANQLRDVYCDEVIPAALMKRVEKNAIYQADQRVLV